MPDSSEGARTEDFPQVESTLFSGLVRVRRTDQDPGVVLDRPDDPEDPKNIGEPGEAAAASPAATPFASARRRYVLQGEIGRGGMGVVYKVLDTDLRRTLAMKVASCSGDAAKGSSQDGDPSLLERFLEEAQVTGQLDHPGIVPLHEVGMDADGRVYFTMRLVKGRHFGQVFELARKGEEGWSEERVLIAIVRICEAMGYVHAKGVVHRDLKPANIMAGRFGEVYVMDWGLAKVHGRASQRDRPLPTADQSQSVVRTRRTREGTGDAHETSHGTVFGTPVYMSPEQARGDVDRVDARSDIYALGAILYHFLTGGSPYTGADARVRADMVLRWVLEGPPKRVRKLAPQVAPELAAICEKAMARDPAARYGDMQEMAADLRSYLAGRSVSALPLGTFARTLRWCGRNQLAAGLLVAITTGSVYGIWCLASLGTDLVRQTALDSAEMKAQILQDVNALYSSAVVSRVDREHVEVTHDYALKAGAIPLPATFLTDLGEKISQHTAGVQVRQYSDYPFSFRPPWNLDGFERRALGELRVDPAKPVYSFEEIGGRPTLRYAVGRRMEASCVACHNTHPASTKTDWKVGDVRGVLEIVRPLDQDVARIRSGLRGTLLYVAAIVGGLLLVSVFGIVRHGFRTRESAKV